MRAVIYDSECHEPLTVIEVPECLFREIEAGQRDPILKFPIMGKPLSLVPAEWCPALSDFKCVTVRFEPIYKGRSRVMWLCTTADPESALLLRASFLPGQRGEVASRTREAFLSGLFALAGVR